MIGFELSRSLQRYAVERMAIVGALIRLEDEGIFDMNKLQDRPYRDAIIKAMKTDAKFLERFMQGDKGICYRNHKRNQRGKLVSVEAYYM